MSRRGRNFSGATPVQPGRGMGEDKYLDTNTPAVDTLYSFMSSLCAASILKSAQDLEIFDVLEEGGPLSAENLAQKKGYYAKSTERLLNTLTSMKLITKESRKSGAQALYGNSEAGKLLAKANPNTLKEIISWMGFFDEGLKQLPEVVKKGPEGFRHDFDEASGNKVDVAEMKKCAHGHYHDSAGNSYDETGKLVHCHGGKTEETKVTDSMEKCQHGNFHDKEGAVYDETGKKIHRPGGDTENQKSATQTKSTENMEKCKHGNFHDEDGTVYDEAGNKIHGPGGQHGGEGEEEENYESDDSIDYYQGMHNLLGASSAKLMTAIDLSGHKSAVDLGGGSGVLCFELKRQYPDMDVTLFELEGIVKIFNERFLPGNEKLGVKVIAGDWNKTPLPAAELYILSQVVHDIDNSGELLKKVYKAIKPGGGILLLEHTLADDKVSLMPPAMWDILMMTHGGCLRSPAEFRMWLTDLGFLDVTVIRTQENNEYDIIYAKKPEHSQNKKSKK